VPLRSTLARARNALSDPAAAARRLATRLQILRLSLTNRLSRRPVTGANDVVVSLTSYGHRLRTVHIAIESIVRDATRPSRFILWVSDPGFIDDLPPALRRLQSRGLEILPSADLGPHKKQYVYAASIPAHATPLVVCDDDAIYPRGWLQGLLAAHARHPGAVLAYRAHAMRTDGVAILPYADWAPAPDETPGFHLVGTGVGGILNPPALLDALREGGEAFRDVAPRADDIWVHFISVRAGLRTVQVASPWRDYPQIPGTQKGTLYGKNVRDGGNDEQVRRVYGPDEIRVIAASATAEAPGA
jgi:hypothetical protein